MVTHHILDASLLVHHGSEHQLPAQVWLLHRSRPVAAWTASPHFPQMTKCISGKLCRCRRQVWHAGGSARSVPSEPGMPDSGVLLACAA